MAVSVDVIEAKDVGRVSASSVPVLALPYNAFTRVTAAGTVTFLETTRVVRLKNASDGDPVWFIVQPSASSNEADATDGILLEAGAQFDFAIPDALEAARYEVDIRAVA